MAEALGDGRSDIIENRDGRVDGYRVAARDLRLAKSLK